MAYYYCHPNTKPQTPVELNHSSTGVFVLKNRLKFGIGLALALLFTSCQSATPQSSELQKQEHKLWMNANLKGFFVLGCDRVLSKNIYKLN
jgi:hypothetical protein